MAQPPFKVIATETYNKRKPTSSEEALLQALTIGSLANTAPVSTPMMPAPTTMQYPALPQPAPVAPTNPIQDSVTATLEALKGAGITMPAPYEVTPSPALPTASPFVAPVAPVNDQNARREALIATALAALIGGKKFAPQAGAYLGGINQGITANTAQTNAFNQQNVAAQNANVTAGNAQAMAVYEAMRRDVDAQNAAKTNLYNQQQQTFTSAFPIARDAIKGQTAEKLASQKNAVAMMAQTAKLIRPDMKPAELKTIVDTLNAQRQQYIKEFGNGAVADIPGLAVAFGVPEETAAKLANNIDIANIAFDKAVTTTEMTTTSNEKIAKLRTDTEKFINSEKLKSQAAISKADRALRKYGYDLSSETSIANSIRAYQAKLLGIQDEAKRAGAADKLKQLSYWSSTFNSLRTGENQALNSYLGALKSEDPEAIKIAKETYQSHIQSKATAAANIDKINEDLNKQFTKEGLPSTNPEAPLAPVTPQGALPTAPWMDGQGTPLPRTASGNVDLEAIMNGNIGQGAVQPKAAGTGTIKASTTKVDYRSVLEKKRAARKKKAN